VLEIQAASGSSDWYFNIQHGAFKRILVNLYGNSLKYTKHGYITISLRTVEDAQARPVNSGALSAPQRATIKLTITDTGRGISPAFLRSKIFTAFSQENRKSAGSGLGLSIVKSLVSQLEGDVDIKSVLNVGTVVTVLLRESGSACLFQA
jgi:signal transduction histidine kinase